MKTLVFISAILLLASCDVYYVEPEPIVVYDPRDQFVGGYEVSEYSSTYDEYWEYGMSVYKSSGNQIVIDNFYNSDLRVYAYINGNNVNIPWQNVEGYELQGSGYLSGTKLIINYKVRDTYVKTGAWDFCEATGWRY